MSKFHAFFSAIVLSFCTATGLVAQGDTVHGQCGLTITDHEHILARLEENKRTIESSGIRFRNLETTYVPVTFHLVGDDQGNGFLNEERLLSQLSVLNKAFEEYNYLFYLDEVQHVSNSTIYNNPRSAAAIFQMKIVRDNNAMNIYIVRDIPSGNPEDFPGTTLGYYDGSNDWVVVRRNEFGNNPLILPHEIGHFFSLEHTFFGWECAPYDEAVHGNPVSSIWTPCISNWRVEFQDGTNCGNSGDRICDTPPDYNFGLGWSQGGDRCAEYNLDVQDPRGSVVDPMENNYMGYFFDCSLYEFTPDQEDMIGADYRSGRRSYLRTGVIPNTDPVSNDVVYNFPINDEVTTEYEPVTLDWEDVPGATHYLVMVDRIPTFTLQPQRFTVDASEVDVEGLGLDLRYYWRVWPYNESITGAGWGETQRFITGETTSAESLEAVDHFGLFPNPVQDDAMILTISSTAGMRCQYRIYNTSGQLLQSGPEFDLQSGVLHRETIDVDNLVSGMYILQVVSNEGILSRKFSVQ